MKKTNKEKRQDYCKKYNDEHKEERKKHTGKQIKKK